jgi:hypothetical protein
MQLCDHIRSSLFAPFLFGQLTREGDVGACITYYWHSGKRQDRVALSMLVSSIGIRSRLCVLMLVIAMCSPERTCLVGVSASGYLEGLGSFGSGVT